MEKIQENNMCKQASSYVFVQENCIKHVCLYFLHLVLTPGHYGLSMFTALLTFIMHSL